MLRQKTNEVVWHEFAVSQADLERLHGHCGVTVWFTGLPSSGKSTLANALAEKLYRRGVSVFVLDGDNVRHGLNRNLGFSPDDRVENIRRIGEVARLFTTAGVVNITAFISPYAEDRATARDLQPDNFVEVFCECSLKECERRDPKGMYRKARRGELQEFTGVDAPYEVPANPELVLRTDEWSIDECVDAVIHYLTERGYVAAEKASSDGAQR